MILTPKPNATTDGRTPTILIVDDNPVNIETLTDYLETCGLEVLIALNGEQGIERAQRAQPNLILLDILMPGMNGIETCRRLKENAATAHIPVIFMTALNEPEYKIQAFQIGAVDYIAKPFEKGEVLARVMTHIQLHTLTRNLEQQIHARTADLERANEQLRQKIAEQIRTETELRESETKYRQLVEQMNEGVVIIQDTRIKYINTYLTNLSGYSTEESLDHPFSEFIPSEERPRALDNYQRRMAGENSPQIYESFIQDKNGSRINVEVNVSLTTYQGKPAELVIIRDVTERKRIEAALSQRVIALARPLENAEISFADLFDLDEIQKIQDAFAQATGVASIITTPDGMPITQQSNFSRLCRDIIRKTEKGLNRCTYSDAMVTQYNPNGATIQPCLSAGLWNCGASISVGERYIANWIIGQVRDENFDENGVLNFAHEIGANEDEVRAALAEVSVMPKERFLKISETLFLLANLMSRIAYQNIQQARFILERDQTEKALRDSEERFRRLTENAKDMIYRMSLPDGVYEYVSPASEPITGYSPEEFYQSPALIQNLIHPDWQKYFRKQFADLKKGILPPYYEYQIIHKSGEVKWINQRNVLIRDENGAPIAIEGIVTDVSERKLAEQEHEQLLSKIQEQAWSVQQIVDTVPEGVLLLDAGRRVTLTNPTGIGDLQTLAEAQIGAVITHLGGRPLETLLTSPPKGLWHEVPVKGREFQIIARSIETGPTPEGWVLVIRDVTHQREFDRHIQQRERLAAVGQLAAGIAHDFNNIMATIVLYAQMTERTQGVPDRIRDRMQTINQQAQHATNLIRQILDFSRRSMIERRPMDLLPFLNEQVKMLKRTLPESISITLAYQPHEYLFNADPTSMQQMIMNLVVNARDAMPDGGTLQIELDKIHIETRDHAPLPQMNGGEWIKLSIADNGVGMSEEILRHLFEPFFTTKAPGQGSGLGLAQVDGIVGSHEGHITAESRPGVGTKFTIYFPALPTQSLKTAAKHKMGALSQGQGETILIVEDNEPTRTALVESLATLGYHVLVAGNGKEALNVLAEHDQEIALILSDVVMPEMGGLALLHTLREQKKLKPFLLLTGHPLENELNALHTSENATVPLEWMTKPPNLEELARIIERILAKTKNNPKTPLPRD